MSAVGPGLTIPQLAKDSLLRLERDFFFAPTAASTAAVVASVDPSGLTVGSNLTLLTLANGILLRRARRITFTVDDDDAGGGLSVTVRVRGYRWGIQIDERLTATAVSGTAVTVTSANCFDQIDSILLEDISTADAGDAIFAGLDGTSFGLDFPIDNVADVMSIINTSTNTEAAATAVSSTTVVAGAPSGGAVAGGSYIKGITLAATDRWEVRYLKSLKQDGSGTGGVWR